MPILVLPDGREYTQSLAQLRYAGRLAKLYPEDPAAGLAVDELLDIGADCLTKCPQDPDPEVKKAKRAEYAAGRMKAYFELLNDRIGRTSGALFFDGGATIADLSIYYLLEMVRTGNFDYVDAAYTDQWPALAKFEAAMKAHDLLAKK